MNPTSAAAQSPFQGLRSQQFAVALVSMSALLLELAMTRLFSVILFYHLAFMVISIALLGLGAGGVFAFLGREWLRKFETRDLAAGICLINSLLIFIVLEVDLHSPVGLDLTWHLTTIYIISATPFFLVGVLFSAVFAREPERITALYGADLIGGALACMLLVPLLNWIGAPNTIVVAAALSAVAATVWSQKKSSRVGGVAIAVAMAVLVAANHDSNMIDIVYAKGAHRSETGVLWARWNAISRVEVDDGGYRGRYIRIDSSASTAIMHVDPEHWDADLPILPTAGKPWRNLVPSEQTGPTYNWKRDLMSAAPAVVNVLRPHGDYAIIGPGGGVDVMRAVANGAKSVTAIEINPLIANSIMRGTHADYSFHLYERPNVHLHVADGRSWIRASKDKYDVIQMTLVDTWASTAAGAFALSENNLYTVEAFKEYFDHLKPDGIIAITRWEFKEPREALRVVSEEIEALRQLGISDPAKHFMVFSDGNLEADGRPVVVLAKKRPFAEPGEEEELIAIRHAMNNRNLHPVYTPVIFSHSARTEPDGLIHCMEFDTHRGCDPDGILAYREKQWVPPSGQQPFERLLSTASSAPDTNVPNALQSNSHKEWLASYPFDVSPVTDDAPFFFFNIKTKDVFKRFLTGTGSGIDWQINLGTFTLGLVFVISVATVFIFLVLPLAVRSETRHAASIPKLLYFVAVGLGFIMVEISFIQRFVLFLGHPVYALTVVVFLLLLSSGAGSLLSRRWMAAGGRLPWILGLIAAAIATLAAVLPKLLASQIGLALPAKIAISAALLVPLGLAMGMPFPTGLSMLADRKTGLVEWAWAMNAAATVLGSVSAIVIAIHFGLTVTLLCGAAAYLLAAAFTPRLTKA